MTQNLDKNKIRDSIQKARPQDMLYAVVNPINKDSKKHALTEINNFMSKGSYEITVIKR